MIPAARGRPRAREPLWNHYQAKDGKWFMLSMLPSDRYWPDFCRVTGLEHLEKDPRFENVEKRSQNAEELISILDELFATKTRDEWFEVFSRAELIVERLQDYEDLISDPQAWANDYFVEYQHRTIGPLKIVGVPFQLSETPGDPRAPAPELGEHTEEVLLEIGGYTWEDIEKLKDEEVI